MTARHCLALGAVCGAIQVGAMCGAILADSQAAAWVGVISAMAASVCAWMVED